MKTTETCPKCQIAGRPAKNVVLFPEVDDATHGGYTKKALSHSGGLLGGRRFGHLEAYVCNDCGYVEFYVKDLPLPTHVDE